MSSLTAALTRADYALFVAIGSLVASIASLSWQLYSALRVDRARLKVTVSAQTIVGGGSRPFPVVVVGVVNRGKRPTQLTSIWLQFGHPWRPWHRLIPKRWRKNQALMVPDVRGQALSAQLPRRLDVGDEAAIFYDRAEVLARASEHSKRTVYGTARGATAAAASGVLKVTELGS